MQFLPTFLKTARGVLLGISVILLLASLVIGVTGHKTLQTYLITAAVVCTVFTLIANDMLTRLDMVIATRVVLILDQVEHAAWTSTRTLQEKSAYYYHGWAVLHNKHGYKDLDDPSERAAFMFEIEYLFELLEVLRKGNLVFALDDDQPKAEVLWRINKDFRSPGRKKRTEKRTQEAWAGETKPA